MSRNPDIGHLGLAVRLVGLGWYVAVCIVAGVLGGLWLDQRTGVTPLFTLVGVGLGLIVAFWGLYRMVAPLLSTPPTRKDDGA